MQKHIFMFYGNKAFKCKFTAKIYEQRGSKKKC